MSAVGIDVPMPWRDIGLTVALLALLGVAGAAGYASLGTRELRRDPE